ncbi:hypothetical protein RCL_jg2060.t1 [Rhizophagus clarus]|uniref:Uncharacterized protein n=1 Tax=Rhizophagus clarus TaxID=94130 RepID=A0A8H3QBD0_9GLOM|nr:hypothetical protein RCL_jg2060.t1 [Rhizophagus clarus]
MSSPANSFNEIYDAIKEGREYADPRPFNPFTILVHPYLQNFCLSISLQTHRLYKTLFLKREIKKFRTYSIITEVLATEIFIA